MNKIFQTILYYILLLIGLITTSWIIWARFIRTRTIRDIPDYLLTEYRFWVLLYICCIYLYVIKSIIKPSKANSAIKEMVDIIYKPLVILDHAIKYNSYVQPYYHKIMIKFVLFIKHVPDLRLQSFVFLMQILPRLILVTFLLLDVFYFEHLEIFYKVVLLGILPFIFRYIKHSLKDVYEHWIVTLENKYSSVKVYEEGYRADKSRINNTEAIHHMEKVSIREYVEIKYENFLTWLGDNVEYEYNSYPYCHDKIWDEYLMEKYNTTKKIPTTKDLANLEALYHELMPIIIELKIFIARLELFHEYPLFKWLKVFIFSMYLLCWSYILFISYGFYPIELKMAKYFLMGLMIKLCKIEDPFSGIINALDDV